MPCRAGRLLSHSVTRSARSVRRAINHNRRREAMLWLRGQFVARDGKMRSAAAHRGTPTIAASAPLSPIGRDQPSHACSSQREERSTRPLFTCSRPPRQSEDSTFPKALRRQQATRHAIQARGGIQRLSRRFRIGSSAILVLRSRESASARQRFGRMEA